MLACVDTERGGRMRASPRAWALPIYFVILVLLLASPLASSAGRGPDRPAPVGDWAQLNAPYGICLCCDFSLPIIVPSHNLVVGMSVGADCGGGMSVADYPSPPGSRYHVVRGGPPPGVPVAGVFDPSGERVLYFISSWDGSGFADLTTWAVTLGDTARWEPIEAPGGPAFRGGSSVIFDTRRDRVVMFGGRTGGSQDLDEVWTLSMRDRRWQRLDPTGPRPPARSTHAAVYDPHRDRMLVFGGAAGPSGVLFSDLWELSLGPHPRWSRLEPDGDGPSARYAHAAIYDAAGRRLLIYGGIETPPHYQLPGDLWEVTLQGRIRWRAVKPRSDLGLPNAWMGAAYDPLLERMLLGDPANLWSLELNSQAGWAGRRPGAEIDPPGRSHPGPAASEAITLGQPTGEEEIRIYDVAGRLMLVRRGPAADTWLSDFHLGSTAETAGLAPGVYFAQRRDRAGTIIGRRTVAIRR
jgi:Kelch motif protein